MKTTPTSILYKISTYLTFSGFIFADSLMLKLLRERNGGLAVLTLNWSLHTIFCMSFKVLLLSFILTILTLYKFMVLLIMLLFHC